MFDESWLGYIFVDVDDEFCGKETILYDDVVLRNATLEELTHHFDFHLDSYWKLRGGDAEYFAYGRTEKEGVTVKPIDDKTKWKHFVIECKNKNVNPNDLNHIFSMSKADFRMGYICFDGKKHSNPWSNWTQLDKWVISPFTYNEKIKFSEVSELKLNIKDFFAKDAEQKHLRLLYMFEYLDNMVDSSPFKYLGYFSILEGLLTHKPNSSDNVDSIQKQLIRNINLINNRVIVSGREGMNIKFFSTLKLKTIFQKLYALRSDIAHGGDYSESIDPVISLISRKDPQKEIDIYKIFNWLRELTKMLLMYSFVEPQLYLDLTKT